MVFDLNVMANIVTIGALSIAIASVSKLKKDSKEMFIVSGCLFIVSAGSYYLASIWNQDYIESVQLLFNVANYSFAFATFIMFGNAIKLLWETWRSL